MRGFAIGLSLLAVAALGGPVAGCGPSKPCQCTQQSGCHCPLPPAPPKQAKPAAPAPAGTESQTAKPAQVAQHAHRSRHARSHGRYAAHSTHARPTRHLAATEEHGWRGRSNTRSANALPYEYRSTSRSYRKGGRFAENYDGYGPAREFGRTGYRRHRRYSQYGYGEGDYGEYDRSGQGYDEGADGYGEDRYGEEPYAEGARDYSEGAAAPMSINAPPALDPWNGYGVHCPNRRGS